jgi:hypothetical protein
MKTKNFISNVGAGFALAVLVAGSVAQADTVYDNSTGDLDIRLNPGTRQIGDEIVLAPGARYLTDFVFQYWGENFFGGEQVRLRFYLNDGAPAPAGPATPGTIFYDSGYFDIGATPRATLIFTDFATGAVVAFDNTNSLLPDSFTWSVQFRGIDSDNGGKAGVDLYNPPTVGTNYLEYWERTGAGWEYRGDTNGTALNFGARVGAVPEPSTIALGLLGGLAALMFRNRFKKS